MLNKKNLIFGAAFLLATALSTITIVNYNNTNSSAPQSNNVVLTEQTNQTGQALETDTVQTDSDSSKDTETYAAEVEENSAKDTKVKIVTYTVKSGDTLGSIASTYNIKAKSIAESNSLSIDSLLKEGQILEFPSVDGVLYKIKDGETLWDLALLNKIDFNKIVEINNIESPEKLKPDQKIVMPGVDTVKTVATSTNSSSIKIIASNKPLSRGGSTPTASSGASLPVKGKITSKFGPRWGKQHTGIDIAAPTGTNVYASISGKVSFSGWDGGYGKLVIIDHGNGLQTYYAHNSELLVKNGQTVAKGAHIAEVGSTGNSTGPHSHFEVRKNGNPVNPYNYVK